MMDYFKEAFAEYLFMFVLFAAAQYLLCRNYQKKGMHLKKGFYLGWQMLACMMTGIIYITGAGGVHDIGRFGSELIRMDEINLIPIVNWGLADIFGLSMNLLMFVPFGIAVPLLFQYGAGLWQTTLCGFTFSLMIELSQLLNRRATDIDDLIMNTLGTIIGFGLYCLLFRKLTFFQMDNDSRSLSVRHSALVTVVLIFLIYFFIGNPVISRIWRAIYGF